jgi:hypothetical protein
MNKSDDFDNVDYSNLPKEIREVVTDKSDIVIKKAKLTFDGNQYIVRIPTDIAKIMAITSDFMMEFEAIIPSPKSNDEKELHMRLVK